MSDKFHCRMYENEFPQVDDVVMVNVRQIADMGAYVKLVRPFARFFFPFPVSPRVAPCLQWLNCPFFFNIDSSNMVIARA